MLINSVSFRYLRGDLLGGLTAAIVALPLALAFGVSSGAGPIAGLYGSALVGFFAALTGGTPSQISGPTGPMTVIITSVITTLVRQHPHTGLAMAFTVVMLGGLFQIAFGLLHLGQYMTLMPYTVISGFMSGIGTIIIVLELPLLLGHSGGGSVWSILQKLPEDLSQANPVAVVLGLLALAMMIFPPAKVNRLIRAPLLALVVTTLISVVLFPDAAIERIGPVPTGFPQPQLPTFAIAEIQDMLRYALMLGVLGSIDSLLTSLVADSLSGTQHDSDKELIGQGIGNVIAGLFGGLPGAGATMRTVVNLQAGGRTPLSGMVHAVLIIAIVFVAGPLTAPIPQAVLAGILLKVGFDIIDWSFIRRAHKISLRATSLMYLVLVLTVFVDLITAVVVGAYIANTLTIKSLTEVQSERVQAITSVETARHLGMTEQLLLCQAEGKVLLFQLGGPLSFGAAKSITRRMSIVQNYRVLILDLLEVPRIGVTATLAIEHIVLDALRLQRQVWIVAQPATQVSERLKKLDLERFREVRWVQTRLEALKAVVPAMPELAPEGDG